MTMEVPEANDKVIRATDTTRPTTVMVAAQARLHGFAVFILSPPLAATQPCTSCADASHMSARMW